VIDEADARHRAAHIRDSFAEAFAGIGATATVYYAGKAFLSSEVARWMVAEGLSIDVASGGELAVALAAGVPPERLGFHGNNKSPEEINRAVTAGVGSIVLDSDIEVERVAAAAARHGVVQSVLLRANSGVNAHTHEYLATAREDQKFGIALTDIPRVVARIRSHESLTFLGLHSHIGSQIFDAGGFLEAIPRLMAVHASLREAGPVPELNIGGGFGIAYTSADKVPLVCDIAKEIALSVAKEARRWRVDVPHIAVEPGRAIMGPAGLTLYTVGTVKDVEVQHDAETAVRRYVSVDGGMSDNLRAALYHADYTARMANRKSDAAPALVRVVGKHCESGDIVVRDDYLPADVQPGDVLAVAATGAYCWSMASNYNYLRRPAVMAVADGAARVIVRGDTEADLLARDAGLDTIHRDEEATP
jgi:diaminopimelate decarboxylase